MENVKERFKTFRRRLLKNIPARRKQIWGRKLFCLYKNQNNITERQFLKEKWNKLYMVNIKARKSDQIVDLLSRIEIAPVKNDTFFYSIDCYKSVELKNRILDNYTVEYDFVVNGSLGDLSRELNQKKGEFYDDEIAIIDAMYEYYTRCQKDEGLSLKYTKQFSAIGSLFECPSNSLFEALQRILFFNQFLWQTRHKLNGLGHLDWLLYDLYINDLKSGRLSQDIAKELIKDFFKVLHENYWFKSSELLGDTGQIIVLGGNKDKDSYYCNELTYLFIEAAMELRLPDPKVLLRCSYKMPNDLFRLALECIATGIGAPFLSNDDVVIPSLINFGYEEKDAYKYVTSACWEPLIPNYSCEQNNIQCFNFADPFVEMQRCEEFVKCKNIEEVENLYFSFLKRYIQDVFCYLSKIVFEEDPLLSLASKSALMNGKDIVCGGAKYSGLGVTTVGLSTVINAITNIQNFVFSENKFNIKEIAQIVNDNYKNKSYVVELLKNYSPHFGNDDSWVLDLIKRIEDFTSSEIDKYSTRLGGKFKYGLSSPNYIKASKQVGATLDGRKNGEPFSVHISSNQALPTTELLSFAMKLDYSGNRINGNVVDFMITPSFLCNNINKYILLLKTAFKGGIYQCQMNVVDSITLIAAKKNPDLFPNLIVRVWGFSAYFKDLPGEYKDLLIERTITSERSA